MCSGQFHRQGHGGALASCRKLEGELLQGPKELPILILLLGFLMIKAPILEV